MENIIKCSTCRKTIIADEEFTHRCQFDLVNIPVSGFFTVKKNGKESVIGLGLNGKSYRFVKGVLPLKRLSDEIKHKDLSDEDLPAPVFGFCSIDGREIFVFFLLRCSPGSTFPGLSCI